MRIKLNEWNQSGEAFGPISTRGMDHAEIESLLRHGRFDWARPVFALFEQLRNFVLFCRWSGEVHMHGHRIGPVHQQIFTCQREATHPRIGESQRAFSLSSS